MAYAGNGKHRTVREPKLFTLTEVAQSIDVSMPTAQRYKKAYQDRIPAVGVGRSQRYPREALKVFEQIKIENLNRRGRPPRSTGKTSPVVRKRTPSRGRKVKARRASGRRPPRARGRTRGTRPAAARLRRAPAALLTLSEISRRTGISYPTCINYVKKHLERIPHVGAGRRRRYPPEAVNVFRELRKQSRRGRRKSSARAPSRTEKALLLRIRELEKSQRLLTRRLDTILKALNAPLKVTVKRG